MARSRLELHQELLDISNNLPVYYQPPEGLKIEYPCIVYEYENNKKFKADNATYIRYHVYNVKYIHRDADTQLPDAIEDHFMYCNRGSRYKADNLYHDMFTIYF